MADNSVGTESADEPTGRRVVIGGGVALVALTSLFGAVLGVVIPARTGLEETTVLAIPFQISPLSFALYGGVAMAVFLLTALCVVMALSRFDENAVE